MPEQQRTHDDIVSLRNNLIKAKAICDERVVVGRANQERYKNMTTRIRQVSEEIDDLRAAANHMVRIVKNVKQYAADKETATKDILKQAIYEACLLVPDSDTAGSELQYSDNGAVSIVNAKGGNINVREGGAQRTLLGVLLKYACLKAQPDAFQCLIFDESFFALSDSTSIAARVALERMSEDVLIICIEQRRNILDGVVSKEFKFVKSNGVTHVKEVKLSGEEVDASDIIS